jgi:hypothetical protein
MPTITLGVTPGGSRLSGYALSEVRLLAAAPYPLLARIRAASDGPQHGLVADLRNGPSVYFGSAGQLAAKWRAATAVLANAGSAGAVYIDVTDPNRPAAGAGADATAAGTGGTGLSSPTTTTGSSSG